MMMNKQKSKFQVSFLAIFTALLSVLVLDANADIQKDISGLEKAQDVTIGLPDKEIVQHSASESLKSISIPFIENLGQVDDRVAYYAPINAGMVYVTRKGELVYKLRGAAEKQAKGKKFASAKHPRGWVLTETLVGTTPEPRGIKQTPTRVSSFIGSDAKQWQKEISTYGEILLGDVYPNVGVSLTAHNATVEKIFTVRPGGSPDSIRLHLSGQEDLKITPDGVLLVGTGLGSVQFSRPVAWQNKGKERIDVEVQWHIIDNGEYGFQVAQYDPATTLYIDPVIQATYLGGSNDESGRMNLLGVVAGGDVIAGGTTLSVDFPGTAGGAQPDFAGFSGFWGDIYIARLSGDLTTLVQVTYLGGSGDDFMSFNRMSADGTALYIAGATDSTDFPGTAGGAQSTFGGIVSFGGDSFVALLSADLTTLHQSTYIGGSGDESGGFISLESNNQLYFFGSTNSTDLPGTAGGAQATYGGGSGDVYVVSLSNDLTTLNQATYFGGSGRDSSGGGLYTRLTGNGFYLNGVTDSTDLPGTAGGLQTAFAGASTPSFGSGDAFIAVLSADLTSIIQATYLGGSEDDSLINMSNASSGSFHLSGQTRSDDLPGTLGGAQPAYAGGGDGYIALVSADLKTLVQATYLGGTGDDRAFLPGEVNGSVYVSGSTDSADFPGTAGGAQPNYGGGGFGGDAYVARLSSDLTTLQQSTYFGGSGDDDGFAFLRSNGDIYISGGTNSTDLPGTVGGIQPAFGGGGDQFSPGSDLYVARLSPDLTTLYQATYYGGNGNEQGLIHGDDSNGTLLEVNNGFYLVGITSSTNLPGVTGGAQDTYAGGSNFGGDAFIAHLSLDLADVSVAPPTTPVDLSGTVKTSNGIDICAMVLASGQFIFSCSPAAGMFSLTDLPRAPDGTVKRQIYAQGFFPKIDILTDSSINEAVVLTRSGTCPNYNTPFSPVVNLALAGNWIDIS